LKRTNLNPSFLELLIDFIVSQEDDKTLTGERKLKQEKSLICLQKKDQIKPKSPICVAKIEKNGSSCSYFLWKLYTQRRNFVNESYSLKG